LLAGNVPGMALAVEVASEGLRVHYEIRANTSHERGSLWLLYVSLLLVVEACSSAGLWLTAVADSYCVRVVF